MHQRKKSLLYNPAVSTTAIMQSEKEKLNTSQRSLSSFDLSGKAKSWSRKRVGKGSESIFILTFVENVFFFLYVCRPDLEDTPLARELDSWDRPQHTPLTLNSGESRYGK